ncbi:MAG TPA: hypothetical protein VHN58_02485 [Croceicoccus sp.]|nr:hypothetical protein [Croceicoccus sp.]
MIWDFCGFLAQVKASSSKNPDLLPNIILGAAWGPQKQRMDSAIYFPLFLLLEKHIRSSIYQPIFKPFRCLSPESHLAQQQNGQDGRDFTTTLPT